MQPLFPTIIIRHQRENLKKCSLRGLEGRSDLVFYSYPKCHLPQLAGYVMLAMDAPLLTHGDSHKGLLVLDGTWRYAQKMATFVGQPEGLEFRSLPKSLRTAYPRRQLDCPDPELGLASIEALFAAYRILGWNTAGLLENYHWAQAFLDVNFSAARG